MTARKSPTRRRQVIVNERLTESERNVVLREHLAIQCAHNRRLLTENEQLRRTLTLRFATQPNPRMIVDILASNA